MTEYVGEDGSCGVREVEADSWKRAKIKVVLNLGGATRASVLGLGSARGNNVG